MMNPLRTMVTRGRVALAALNPKRTLVQFTGLASEAGQNVELLLPYGMSALPKGGDLILLQIGGTRSHLVALCADDPSLRIADLQEGEFGFRDARGQQTVYRKDHLEITTPLKAVINITGDCDLTVGGKVIASASEFDLTGDVKVTGNISATGNVSDGTRSMAGDRGIYNGHTHGGVQGGASNTAPPNQHE